MIRLLEQQAQVHDRQPCCGLPLCAACRAAALLQHDLDIEASEQWIDQQPTGTVVRLGPRRDN